MTNAEFEAVYRENFSAVFRYARSLCRDAGEAEELTSDTFFRAMQAIGSFRGECEVRSWLCAIARNAWLARVRERGREQLSDVLPERADPAPSPQEQLEPKEEARRVLALVHLLPEPYKEVFLLRSCAELAFRDIGVMFQKSENWACVTYHRARQKLLAQMQTEERSSGTNQL